MSSPNKYDLRNRSLCLSGLIQLKPKKEMRSFPREAPHSTDELFALQGSKVSNYQILFSPLFLRFGWVDSKAVKVQAWNLLVSDCIWSWTTLTTFFGDLWVVLYWKDSFH